MSAKQNSPEVAEIFSIMQASPMANWVGDGDPLQVGRENYESILSNIGLDRAANVLDFGCGIGRTAVFLADHAQDGRVVGVDIVDQQIAFCRQEIAARFKNSEFYTLDDENPLYDHFMTSQGTAQTVSPAAFGKTHEDFFSLICAFSVFTHFDPAMTRRYLDLFNQTLRRDGTVFLTCFLDHPLNPEGRKLKAGEGFRDCVPRNPMLFTLFDVNHLAALAAGAGFRLRRVVFGHWRGVRGAMPGVHYQDVAVLEKTAVLPPDFDAERYLAINADVKAAGVDAAQHYLSYGFYENRSWR